MVRFTQTLPPRVQLTPTPAAPLWTQTSPWRRTGRVPGEKWRARRSSSWKEPRYTRWRRPGWFKPVQDLRSPGSCQGVLNCGNVYACVRQQPSCLGPLPPHEVL